MIISEFKLCHAQLGMLLLELLWVEVKLPWLLLALLGFQWLFNEVVVVLFELVDMDLAMHFIVDLDETRPSLMFKLLHQESLI